MGALKNRLNETVLLSTQNICLELWVRKYLQFYAEIVCLSKPVVIVLALSFHLSVLQSSSLFSQPVVITKLQRHGLS